MRSAPFGGDQPPCRRRRWHHHPAGDRRARCHGCRCRRRHGHLHGPPGAEDKPSRYIAKAEFIMSKSVNGQDRDPRDATLPHAPALVASPGQAGRPARPAAGRLLAPDRFNVQNAARTSSDSPPRAAAGAAPRQRESPRLSDRDLAAVRLRRAGAGGGRVVARGRCHDPRRQHHRHQARAATGRRRPRLALRLGGLGPGWRCDALGTAVAWRRHACSGHGHRRATR